MTREEKIDELYNFCNMHDSCDQCELDDLASACEFEDMCNKKIDRFYDVMVGHETKVGDDAKEKTKTVTENLTGVVKEEPKTIAEILEEVSNELCDHYCKYPNEITNQEELKEKCLNCPLRKLN